MKRILALLLVLAMCLSLVACGSKNDDEESKSDKSSSSDKNDKSKQNKTIAVIAPGESHTFWQAVKAGAQAAADEMGYKLTFQGTDMYSASEQQEMMQTALSNKASGIVLSTVGSGFGDMLTQAYDKNIPIVTFDSGLQNPDEITEGKNPIVAHVAVSNKGSGAIAAEKLFMAIKDDIANASAATPYVVGIIQYDQTSTAYDRVMGFQEKFTALADADYTTNGKYMIYIEVKSGPTNQAYAIALEALHVRGAKAVFMANESVVMQVSEAIYSNPGMFDDITFVGFDAGSRQAFWVAEKTNLIGSVARDSYALGYQAVMQCIAAVEGESPSNIDIPGAWYDATNLKELAEKNIVYMNSSDDKASLINSLS